MRFDDCLAFILRPDIEGGYVNNPRDPGGATNHGVTQSNYDAWRIKQGLPTRPVKEITDDEVRSFYMTEYWAKSGCAAYPEPIDLVVFDAAVNDGVVESVRWLQAEIGVKQDGRPGAVTNAAVLGCEPMETALKLIDVREDHYHNIVNTIPARLVFLHGWLNRLDKLRTEITRPS